MVEYEEIANRIRNWMNGKVSSPYKVDFFLTERCNLRCLFCNFPLLDKARHERELTSKELLKIVEWCGVNDVRIIGILGGEPFCRKEVLLEIMKKIKGYGIDGSLVTNGTLLDEKTVEEIVEMEWDLIRFSVDGMENAHDFLRNKKGSFKKVVKAIETFRKVKRKLKKDKPSVEINTVLCDKNYREAVEIVELASSLNCRGVYFLPMVEFTEFSRELRILNVEEARNLLLEAKKVADGLSIFTNIEEILTKDLITPDRMNEVILPSERIEDEAYIPCFLPWYTLCIDALGNAIPCCNLSPIGENVREKDLDEIWFGSGFSEFRERMKNKEIPEECSRCCLPLEEENRIIRKILSNDLG